MFDNLSDKLDKAFHILKGHGKNQRVNVAETLKEVRRALLMPMLTLKFKISLLE
jgi:signal recognition particle subunit SRP54